MVVVQKVLETTNGIKKCPTCEIEILYHSYHTQKLYFKRHFKDWEKAWDEHLSYSRQLEPSMHT